MRQLCVDADFYFRWLLTMNSAVKCVKVSTKQVVSVELSEQNQRKHHLIPCCQLVFTLQIDCNFCFSQVEVTVKGSRLAGKVTVQRTDTGAGGG